MFIKDLETGKVRRYGTNPHDSLVISNDGRTISYYNLQNGDGSRYGGYVFCDDEGKTPAEIDFHAKNGADIYFNIGGFKDRRENMANEEQNNYRGKKMKIAIEITKRLYEATKNGLDPIDVWNLRKAVRDGTILREADEELNNYCGLCGQRLDWEHPENPDEEEAEEKA